jgi:hypothetical protein
MRLIAAAFGPLAHSAMSDFSKLTGWNGHSFVRFEHRVAIGTRPATPSLTSAIPFRPQPQ